MATPPRRRKLRSFRPALQPLERRSLLSVATFLAADTSTQGDWRGAYGGDGYDIAQDASGTNPSLPSYASVSVSGNADYTWSDSTSDASALQDAAGTGRIAACWFTSGSPSFDIDADLTDGQAHRVALYALDWWGPPGGRSERIDVIDDATGTVLDSRSISSFRGWYLSWDVQGSVIFRVTNTSSDPSSNAVVSGLFFGGGEAKAVFQGLDTSTQGDWRGAYGGDGYDIAQDASGTNPSLPSYASVSVSGNADYTWSDSTSDASALQDAAGTGRIAACWFTSGSPSFDIDADLTDGQAHRVALYALDWWGPPGGRSERIDVIDDATGTVLDSRSISSFRGWYLSWDVTGSVTFRVTNTSSDPSSNAVVSGIFFDTPTEVPSSGGYTISAVEGQAFTSTVAAFIPSDPNAQPSDFTATIDWGDGGVTTGDVAYNDESEVGGFKVSGTYTYANEGSYTTSIQVNTPSGVITIGGTALVAAPVSDAPLSDGGQSIETTVGEEFDGVVATFSVADQGAQADNYTATIDWGDGNVTTGDITFDDAIGAFDVSGAHTYTDEGTYATSVQVSANDGNAITIDGTATAENPPSSDGGGGDSTTFGGSPSLYNGHVAATVASFAAAGTSSASGSLSISGLPASAKILTATLYAANYNGAAPNPTMIFAGNSLGRPSSSAANGQMVSYKWDVTNLVTGNGSYNATISGMVYNYGITLLVVYSDPSLPLQRVMVNDKPADLNPGLAGPPVTFQETYNGVMGGIADIWVHTDGDNTNGAYPWGTNEQIKLNNDVVGGPIDTNLGNYASLIHLTNLTATSGTDTISITTPQDWFGWDLTIFTTSTIDLSIDSDNTQGFNPPVPTDADEKIKDDPTKPGKIILADDNKDNGGSIPDFAVFGTPSPNEHFVPMVLTLPPGLDPDEAAVTFTYDASDPNGISISGTGTSAVYGAAPGHLRIWTVDGNVARNKNSVDGGGNYVESGIAHSAASLGFRAGVNSVTLYVEGISASAGLGDQRIKVEVDPDGAGGPGTASDAVRTTVVSVKLEQIDFTGTNIRIDGSTDIPGDVEWVNGKRDQPNVPGKPWDPTQSAPAAFVKGNPITGVVTFTVSPAAITQIQVAALNRTTGPYGNITLTTVSLSSGKYTASFTTDPTAVDNNVDVNTLTFLWQLQNVTLAGSSTSIPLPADIQQTQHRIYTLYAAPVAPMAEPWAKVLELSAGIVKAGGPLGSAAGDDAKIVAQLTRGIYNSKWTSFSATADFINPTGRLSYNPEKPRTTITGPGGSSAAGGAGYVSQEYPLTAFLALISSGVVTEQQCNDNSNLLAILADSLGISVTPLWFAQTWPVDPADFSTFLPPTNYYGAGKTVRSSGVIFTFHQIDSYMGNIYDPSTGPAAAGDPTMSGSFDDYLHTFAPSVYPLPAGAKRKYPIRQSVTTITVR
jgi:hypothetical protein